MAHDLTGGLDPGFEYFQPSRPADSGMRDSATLWVIDQAGRIALPRVTFDAIGADWETPWVQLNLVLADGRAARIWATAPGSQKSRSAGQVSIRRAGPLEFTCVEPFERWTMEFDGEVAVSTTAAELAGAPGGTPARLKCRFEVEMVVPPWLMGAMNPEAAQAMQAGNARALMGGVRYEQICRVRGFAELDGERFDIDGTGMRVRRQGVRNMGAALGHCQHSALFASGRAFGAIIMAAGPVGPVAFNEAFVIGADGRKRSARVVAAPWMTRLIERGDDATLVLDADGDRIVIGGEVLLSMFDHHNFEMAETSILHQGSARYVWNGEETIGLIERCTLRDRLVGAGP